MLKTLSTKSIEPKKDVVKVGGDNKEEHRDRAEPVGIYEFGGNKINDEIDNEVGKNQKMSKSKKIIIFSDFFISGAKLAFTKFKQAFFKTPIFYHFDLEHHIWIETDVSGYTISEIFNQLILNNLSQ